MTQYRLRKCLKGRLRKHYIAKYHVWCIDWCLFLSVFDTYLPLLVLNIALFYSELSCHFVSYRPGYHLHFYLVVRKMSLVLPWQPPADNDVCFCLVKEYHLYICWKIKLLLHITDCERFQPMREAVSYVTSSPIGWGLSQPWITDEYNTEVTSQRNIWIYVCQKVPLFTRYFPICIIGISDRLDECLNQSPWRLWCHRPTYHSTQTHPLMELKNMDVSFIHCGIGVKWAP